MKKKLYLAYGSNLNVEQMRYRCPDARPVGIAELKDWELLFKGSGSGFYLTVERKKGSVVPVGVWEISPEDEAALDRYEGCPRFYYKRNMILPVHTILPQETDPVRRKALIYIMHEDRKLGKPSVAYWRTCMQGYRDFGFEPDPLLLAMWRSSGEPRSRARKGGESA